MHQRSARLLALLILLLAAGPAFAGSSVRRTHATKKGSLDAGFSVGFLTTKKNFDKDGTRQDLKDSITGIPIVLEARYGVIDGLDVGIDFSLQRNSSGDNSGFGIRELIIGAGYELSFGSSSLLIDAGFKIDLGKKAKDLDKDGMLTSDNQNGIAAGLTFNHALSSDLDLRIGVGLVLNLEDSDTKLANGILIDPSVGIAYKLSPALSLGLDIGFLIRGESKFDGNSVTDSGQNLLYALPWLGYNLNDSQSIFLALGVFGEDATVGYPIIGKNQTANVVPSVTIGWKGTFDF